MKANLFKIVIPMLLISYTVLKYMIGTEYLPDGEVLISANERVARDDGRLYAKYIIESVDLPLADSLKKYEYESIIDTISFFIEKSVYYSAEKVFLTRKSVIDNFLIYRSPFLGDCDNIKKYHHILGENANPDLVFIASFEDSSRITSDYRRSYKAIYLKKYDFGEYTPKEIEMFCFFGRIEKININFSYLGKVKLKLIEEHDIPNSSNLTFYFLYPTNIPKLQLECW